jgi:hypothetical protein
VAGVFLLRLVKDMKDVRIDAVALEAFREADFPNIEAYFPPAQARKTLFKTRTRVTLRYSLGIAAVSLALTITGLTAALWHMAWWVGVVFLVAVVACTGLVMIVMARSLPPESEAEKELKRRFGKHREPGQAR